MSYVLLLFVCAAVVFLVLPMILWAIEVPLLRRVHNFATGKGFTPCSHQRVLQSGTSAYGGQCVDCTANIGEAGVGRHSKAELEEHWQNLEEYNRRRGPLRTELMVSNENKTGIQG